MSNPFLESVQNVADEELVPKALGGDRDALERLLARHQPWILNVAVRMLGQRQDAEDATRKKSSFAFSSRFTRSEETASSARGCTGSPPTTC
jgi:DNA-directed RNA polymerase specialized sigma24 family protein